MGQIMSGKRSLKKKSSVIYADNRHGKIFSMRIKLGKIVAVIQNFDESALYCREKRPGKCHVQFRAR